MRPIIRSEEKNFRAPLCAAVRFWFHCSATLKGLDPVTEYSTSLELALAEHAVPPAAAVLAAADLARVALILISPTPSGAERPSA